MGKIFVEGIGEVEIAGDVPTEEESRAIASALQRPETSNLDVRSLETRPTAARPRTLEELTGGAVNKQEFMLAGGLTGGAAGAAAGIPTGPGALLTGAAGGALGTLAGAQTFETVEEALRFFGVLGPSPLTNVQRLQESAREATIDMAFGLGAPVVRPLLLTRRVLAKSFGLGKEAAKQAITEARLAGIQLGALDVGGALPKGFAKVIGIFPWTGGPIRQSFVGKQAQAQQAVTSLLDTIAPNAILASELGIDMVKAAQGAREEFKNVAGSLYQNFRTAMRPFKDVEAIPTDALRELGKNVAGDVLSGEIELRSGEKLGRVAANEMQEFLVRLRDLPDNISFVQHQALLEDLTTIINRNEADGGIMQLGVDAKQALELGLTELRDDLFPDLKFAKQLLKGANEFYAKGLVRFRTPVASKFKNVDRNIFKAGKAKPGTFNEDQIADIALNLQSPKAVNDLRQLVGDELMSKAARLRVERAADLAFEAVEVSGQTIPVLNTQQFAQELGLSGRKGAKESQGLRALLKNSGITVDQLESLINTVERIEKAGSAAQFVTRRIVLGGLTGGGAAAAGVGGAVAAKSGVKAGVLAAFLSRFGAKAVSNPESMKTMLQAFDTQISQGARAQAVGRLVNALRSSFEAERSQPVQVQRRLARAG